MHGLCRHWIKSLLLEATSSWRLSEIWDLHGALQVLELGSPPQVSTSVALAGSSVGGTHAKLGRSALGLWETLCAGSRHKPLQQLRNEEVMAELTAHVAATMKQLVAQVGGSCGRHCEAACAFRGGRCCS